MNGYRKLTDKEQDLVHQVRAYESVFLALVGQISEHIHAQRTTAVDNDDEMQRMNRAEPERWLAIGETHLQQGCMAIIRAVSQPEPFFITGAPQDEHVHPVPQPR